MHIKNFENSLNQPILALRSKICKRFWNQFQKNASWIFCMEPLHVVCFWFAVFVLPQHKSGKNWHILLFFRHSNHLELHLYHLNRWTDVRDSWICLQENLFLCPDCSTNPTFKIIPFLIIPIDLKNTLLPFHRQHCLEISTLEKLSACHCKQ